MLLISEPHLQPLQELHRRGHEIATFSVSSKEDASYWNRLSWDDWFDEIAGGRSIIERFADIKDSTVIGMRAPLLQVIFSLLSDQSGKLWLINREAK